MTDLRRALNAVNDLRMIRDPELLVLRAHLALERVLVTAVAARLKTFDEKVPRLKFGSLVELAFGAEEDRRYLLRLNDLRNSLAHEFDALESEQFRRAIRRFDVPWPNGSLERCIVLEQLFLRAIRMTMLQEAQHLLPPEPDPEDLDGGVEHWEELTAAEADAQKKLTEHDAMLDEIRGEDWDRLVRVYRPGWRDE